jgi:hypothetical protein
MSICDANERMRTAPSGLHIDHGNTPRDRLVGVAEVTHLVTEQVAVADGKPRVRDQPTRGMDPFC